MLTLSHCIEEFNEYLDYLWPLYNSLSTEGFVIIMGDLNGDLGNALCNKGCYAPNDCSLRKLMFLIVGRLNRQSIIFYCLTVYMTALFLVNHLSRLLRIHQIISQFN